MQVSTTKSKYLHEEKANDEGRALTIADFSIMDGIGFHDIEQGLLADAVLLLEELVLWISPGNVATNHLNKNKW